MLLNQPNTLAPLFETFRNARQPRSQVNSTAVHGTPRFVVRSEIPGACPFSAMEQSTREPEYTNALPADQAEVRIAVLMMWLRIGMPAF
jgi:hypothetical protein